MDITKDTQKSLKNTADAYTILNNEKDKLACSLKELRDKRIRISIDIESAGKNADCREKKEELKKLDAEINQIQEQLMKIIEKLEKNDSEEKR